VPLAAGSVVGSIFRHACGVLLGLGAYHTFFFIVLPILAGGVGEGAIPLSIGYPRSWASPGRFVRAVLPPVMLGSLTAILLAGTLNFVASATAPHRRRPPAAGEDDAATRGRGCGGHPVDVTTIGAASSRP